MAKKVRFGLRAWLCWATSGLEFKHLNLEIFPVEVCDAAKEVAVAAQRGYGTDYARERLDKVLAATDGRNAGYLDKCGQALSFTWQTDREKNFREFYAFKFGGCDVDESDMKELRRVFGILQKADAVGFSCSPVKVWQALRDAGAVWVEVIKVTGGGYVQVDEVPEEFESSAVAVESVA